MDNLKDAREFFAAGNAAAPQKLEITGFTDETQAWAWEAFKVKAKWLARKNHFAEPEWTAMESYAVVDILRDENIVYEAMSDKTAEQYLRGVIKRKLEHAAARVADERSVWTESCRSLDAACGADEDSGSLGDLVIDGADLNVNQKFIKQPRAVRIRNEIKRLRNAKDHEGLALLRAKLRGEKHDSPSVAAEADESREADDAEANDLLGETPVDEFADDAETLNRSVFSAADHHAKAVAECGFAPCEDDEVPQVAFRTRSPGLGMISGRNNRLGLKGDVKSIMAKLPDNLREWCRRVKAGEDPVETYKELGITKNDYYKKALPLLREAFAELADAR